MGKSLKYYNDKNEIKKEARWMMDLDTITSISTPMGEGAIGIVRLSGVGSEIADKLFKGKENLKMWHLILIMVI